MGRRRDFAEGYEDARGDMMEHETGSRQGSNGAFTAAAFIKYAAIVISRTRHRLRGAQDPGYYTRGFLAHTKRRLQGVSR